MVYLQQNTIRPQEAAGREKDPLRLSRTIKRPGTTGKPPGGVCLPPGPDLLKASRVPAVQTEGETHLSVQGEA